MMWPDEQTRDRLEDYVISCYKSNPNIKQLTEKVFYEERTCAGLKKKSDYKIVQRFVEQTIVDYCIRQNKRG